MDLVYRPARTAWLQAAEVRGLEADNGLTMLVHQAAHAFHLWTGREAPRDVMRSAAEASLAGKGL